MIRYCVLVEFTDGQLYVSSKHIEINEYWYNRFKAAKENEVIEILSASMFVPYECYITKIELYEEEYKENYRRSILCDVEVAKSCVKSYN